MSSTPDDAQGGPSALDQATGVDEDEGRAANIRQIRGSSLLLVGRMIGLALDFVAQILIVRYLEKTEYGAFALALSIIALGTTVCLLGLERTVGRFAPIYQEKGDIGRMWGTIVTIVATVVGIGLALVLAVYAFQGAVGGLVQNELALSILLVMIVLSPLQALDSLLIALFATFGSARSIFFRRYVIAPVLQLSVVVALIATGSDVRTLALGYVAATAVGIAIMSVVLLRLLQRQGLLAQLDRKTLRLPVREVFTFSVPLLASDIVFVLRSSVTVILIEVLRSTEEVADYRAVLPIAVQNLFVATSFRFIFTPGAARLYARADWRALNDLYWRTATWIAMLSFPLFALCVAFGEPLVVLLFGEPYRSSGTVLSILCIGYYINGATGFNALVLRVFGRVKFMVSVDIATAVVSLVVTVLLIIEFGAVGAAIGTTISYLMQKLLYQWGLRTQTTVLPIDPRYVRPYVMIAGGVIVAVIFDLAFQPPLLVGMVVVGLVSFVVLGVNRHVLQVVETYPELGRFKLIRRIFGDPSTT